MAFILLILTFMLPIPIWAADGDRCESTSLIHQQERAVGERTGPLRVICRKLCDSHVAADPATCDMEIRPSATTIFQWTNDEGCSGSPTVTIAQRFPSNTCTDLFDTGNPQTSGSPDGLCDHDASTVQATTAGPTFADLGTLSVVGDALVASEPIIGDVRATISNDIGCALCVDNFDNCEDCTQTTGQPDLLCDSDGRTLVSESGLEVLSIQFNE